jgi:hypothetical protein
MKEKHFKIFAGYQAKLVHKGGEINEDDLCYLSMKERNIMLIILTYNERVHVLRKCNFLKIKLVFTNIFGAFFRIDIKIELIYHDASPYNGNLCWILCLCVMRTEKLEREAATKEEQFLLQILC